MAKREPQIEFALRTEGGPVRRTNEDSVGYLAPTSDDDARRLGHVFVVCDGMGGHGGGQPASSTAVDTFLGYYRERAPKETVREALAGAVQRANDAIANGRESSPELAKMGSTLTAAAIVDGAAHIAHIGDSVCHLIRGGQIHKLTNDHSVVGEMVRAGMLTEEQALHHPDRSKIRKYLGKPQTVEPDISGLDLEAGDALVLASDGLTAAGLTSQDVLRCVDSQPARAACDKLIEAALAAGAPDNTSVGVIRYGKPSRHRPRRIARVTTARGAGGARRPSLLAYALLVAVVAVGVLFAGYRIGTRTQPLPEPDRAPPPAKTAPAAASDGIQPDMDRLHDRIGKDKKLSFYRREDQEIPALAGPGRTTFIVHAEGENGSEIWRIVVNNENGFIEEDEKVFPTVWDEREADRKSNPDFPDTTRPGG